MISREEIRELIKMTVECPIRHGELVQTGDYKAAYLGYQSARRDLWDRLEGEDRKLLGTMLFLREMLARTEAVHWIRVGQGKESRCPVELDGMEELEMDGLEMEGLETDDLKWEDWEEDQINFLDIP